MPLPRAHAERSVLDISEFFGSTSGGVRTYLIEKARYVERSHNLRQTILVPGPLDAVTQSERVRCYWLGSMRVPGQSPYRFLLDMPASRRIIARERPDIVEVGSSGLAPWHVAVACHARGIPLVSFFHSHLPRVVAGSARPQTAVSRAATALAWRYLRRLDRMYVRTIASSRFAVAELAAGGIERTTYIPLGVDLDQFTPHRRATRADIRIRLAAGDRPLVVFAGRIAAEKRLDLVLRAWPRVSRRTGAVLVIAGDGPLRTLLQRRHPHPDVRWVGHIPRRDGVADLLAAADVAVSPGSIETFGLAALESLASGTPVLSASEGGAAELVVDSKCGSLFECGDSAGFATALEGLLSRDHDALGALGRAHAERYHKWESVFSSVFRMYDEVLWDGR
ncbi:MAG: glycosyltransferase [bacterium]